MGVGREVRALGGLSLGGGKGGGGNRGKRRDGGGGTRGRGSPAPTSGSAPHLWLHPLCGLVSASKGAEPSQEPHAGLSSLPGIPAAESLLEEKGEEGGASEGGRGRGGRGGAACPEEAWPP